MTASLFDGRAPRLWLRLEQHADKPIYARLPEDTADGYIVNANLVESAAASCASFLGEQGKPFLIDPMSYRFERTAWYTRDKDGVVTGKRNYARLWGRYSAGVDGLTGDPLQDRGGLGVTDEPALARYCRNVVDFQEARLAHAWLEDGIQYSNNLVMFSPDQLGLDVSLAPAAYIAPYVIIDGEATKALADRAIMLAGLTATVARPRPVFAVLALADRALSDRDLLRYLARSFAGIGVAGVLLWPVDISAADHAESPSLFTGLTMLIRGLRDGDLEVGMLYGGFLSALLRGFGVSAISHASLYAEQRGLDPGGGRAPARFYFPPLRTFVSYDAARSLVLDLPPSTYLERVCRCGLCVAISSDDVGIHRFFATESPDGATRPIPTGEAADLNRLHFLLARGRELAMARNQTEDELLAGLAASAEAYPSGVSRAARAWSTRLRAA